MTQADSVHSTPPTDTPIPPASATGALSCPASVSRASPLDACQASAAPREPSRGEMNCSPQAGPSMTRRTIMNSLVALPIAAAVQVASPALPSSSDARLLELEKISSSTRKPSMRYSPKLSD
jgi:hypothetical protein